MRESLRRLPPAYIRGEWGNSPPSTSTPLQSRQVEEDLPAYSREDPLKTTTTPATPWGLSTEAAIGRGATSRNYNVEAARLHQRSRIEDSEDEEEDGDQPRTRFRSRLVESDDEDEDNDARSRDTQQVEIVQMAQQEGHMGIAADYFSRDVEAAGDSNNDNIVEVMPSAKRRRTCGCECGISCWIFWLFWVAVIAIAAGVSFAQTQ